ncbi:MAG: hypothetical protein IKO44_04195 [Ruminococcus sp.]|nr:hypothetical protein [Ruminococcus sp.]
MWGDYSICGLKVRAEFRLPRMIALAEKYRCEIEGEPDIELPFSDERFEYYRKKYPAASDSDCEVLSSGYCFYVQLFGYGAFFLHSSAVVVDDKAYLFAADSGVGKSTHTQLWLKHFGERAYILNDDKPVIMQREGKIFAWGTPWSGKSDLNENRCVPLQGICLLERSLENSIRPASFSEALPMIMKQTIMMLDEAEMDGLLTVLDEILPKCRIWRMGCNISEEAAVMAYEEMNKKQ